MPTTDLAAGRAVAWRDTVALDGHRAASAGILALFSSTLFVSAFLLFLVEPMVARMVLPRLGGAAMVWNACIVFFQLVLLAGYAYGYGAAKWVSTRWQIALHMALLALPFTVLPLLIERESMRPPAGNPVLWLLFVLAGTIGLPFFALSTSASVLQHWFSRTGHAAARDPYFLYVASNVGSFLALGAYPTIVEPRLPLADQSRLWTAGYAMFAVLAVGCATVAWRGMRHEAGPHEGVRRPSPTPGTAEHLTLRRRLRWIALAFIPSSLMLAVTTYLSTDLASVPLLWIVPLGLYLLTFVAAFSASGPLARRVAQRAFPLFVVPLVLLMSAGATKFFSLLFPLHLVTFLAAALLCHSQLADDRPGTPHLAEFYLWISFGGMAGGLFNALIAPLLFTSIAEYPIGLTLACLMLPRTSPQGESRHAAIFDVLLPAGIGVSTVAIMKALSTPLSRLDVLIGAVAVPAVVAFSQRRRPVRFAASIGALLVAGLAYSNTGEPLLYAERTFFGVYRVNLDRDGRYRALTHGTTLHGVQALEGPDVGEPLTYYHREGPFGQAFAELPRAATGAQVAVIGLGIGTLAAYAHPSQQWTFFEIDPAVERIARDPKYFNFLDTCGERCRVVIGDARLSLAREQDRRYDLLVLDAFSSDAIPVHLLTSEALELYLAHLAPGGAVLFHISNRHLALAPVVGRLAERHHLAAYGEDYRPPADPSSKRTPSSWVVMARAPQDLGAIRTDPRWAPLEASPSAPLWTDDFSNIVSVLDLR